MRSEGGSLSEFSNTEQNNFIFADKKGIFYTSEAFVIRIYSTHIDILRKQVGIGKDNFRQSDKYEDGPIFKTFNYASCTDLAPENGNKIFEKIRDELYKGYIVEALNNSLF